MPSRCINTGSEAWPVIGTGRVCGTSPSSAPSETTTCTPSASARSTICELKLRHRIEGSTPWTSTRSRCARGAGASKTSTEGQLISRFSFSPKRTHGRLAWKS